MKKWFVRVELIVFFVLLIAGMARLYDVFKYREMGGGGGYENFYAAKKNSIDVMIYGSSHASCTVNNGMLWDDAGISSFILSSGSQSIDSTYYFIKESLKTQHPKVIMVETLEANGQEQNDDGTYQVDLANVYRSDLSMHWSPLYVNFVLNQTKLYGFDNEFRNELLLKMPIIHARYSELERNDFVNEYYFKRGYGGSYDLQVSDPPQLTEDRTALSPMGEEYLQKIIDLCKQENIGLVLFCAPYPETTDASAQQNAIADFAKANGTTFFDFNTFYQKIGIDFSTDYRDGNHLNNSGADKVTKYLEDYIRANYDLTDHRGNAAYKVWDENSRYLQDKDDLHELQTVTDLNAYLAALGKVSSKYDIIVSLDGDYNAQGDTAYASSLANLGIDMDSYHQGGTFVLHQGQFEYYSGTDETFSYTGQFGNQAIAVDRKAAAGSATEDADGGTEGTNINDGLYIGETNYASAVNGVNIVVYDPEINLVVDSIGVDVFEGLTPERPDWLVEF